jgi:hypothetical protein
VQRFRRPAMPAEFLEAVHEHRESVRQAILAPSTGTSSSASNDPVPDHGTALLIRAPAAPENVIAGPRLKSSRRKAARAASPLKPPRKTVKFPDTWKNYKGLFAEAQHGKCGYCEMMVTGGQPGDVEHFYPKGEVWALRPDTLTWGAERSWASTVEGRLHDVLSDQGYWWLAYDWSNYLLACTVCNSYWKLSFFPVEEESRALPPSADVVETPLLLNPFGSHEPAAHLSFTEFGQIVAKDLSRFGAETIRTCGLDRVSLVRARLEKARRAHFLARELVTADKTEKIVSILRDFQELGREEYVHSGMVRAIFKDLCGTDWNELEEMLASAETLESEVRDKSPGLEARYGKPGEVAVRNPDPCQV